MKLISITTHPFAGVANRTTTFKAGLNVIMGPNEAGKSTMMKALYYALFYPTNLTPNDLKRFKARYFPVDGDCAQVELVVEHQGQTYKVFKRWGTYPITQLTLPNGSLVSEDVKARQILLTLTRHNAAAYSHVLMANQTELYQTIARLREQKDREALHSFNALLRNAVMAQGGINADKLRELVDKKVLEYDNNWDLTHSRPSNGKDLDQKHKNKVGLVLEAYYQLREAQVGYQQAIAYEKQLDSIIGGIEATRTEVDNLDAFLKEYEPLYVDIQKREKLRLAKQKAELDASHMIKAATQWPQLLTDQRAYSDQLRELDSAIKQLNDEMVMATKREAGQHLVAQYQQIAQVRLLLASAISDLDSLKKVTSSDCRKAGELASKIYSLQIQLEAQRLRLRMFPLVDCQISLSVGLDQKTNLALTRNHPVEVEAAGIFELTTDQLCITTVAGEGEVELALKDLKDLQAQLASLLASFDVQSVEELEAAAQLYRRGEERVRKHQTELETLLGGKRLEELEAQIRELNALPATRSVQTLQAILMEKKGALAVGRERLSTINQNLADYERQYGTVEALTEKWQSVKREIEQIEDQLKVVKLLPEGFAGAEAFSAQFEQARQLFHERQSTLHRYELKRKELEKHAPALDSEEYGEQITQAERLFQKRSQEAAAYRKIKEELDGLLQTLHGQTYEPLYQRTKAYLSELTLQKYNDLLFDESLPVKIGSNGAALQVELLSQGTLGCLALALRLAMAEKYLGSGHGFFALDDPLVDMDPQRQGAAVACIQRFAQQQQVIIFTCNPQNAESLGGVINKISSVRS